jgi:hypothetical protein
VPATDLAPYVYFCPPEKYVSANQLWPELSVYAGPPQLILTWLAPGVGVGVA